MKIRLDEYIVQNNLIDDNKLAQSLIMQGFVYVNEQIITKAGTIINKERDRISIKQKDHDYVSRGALKLIKALDYFNVNPQNLVCLDIGSSTGGFTEVLLRRGARHIFSVDVGYGELHYKLRNNPTISVLERNNAKYLTKEQITLKPDLIVCDASFISLMSILPKSIELSENNFTLIALIKPQFEAEKHEVSKTKGIIKDSKIHQRVCATILRWLEHDYGFYIEGIIISPITGAKGNQEFLICAKQI
jgi:23S rRNA (cytidine1920-2'-O)/16S rRNA (cytidine1409-2'-O)-methyltransferase